MMRTEILTQHAQLSLWVCGVVGCKGVNIFYVLFTTWMEQIKTHQLVYTCSGTLLL